MTYFFIWKPLISTPPFSLPLHVHFHNTLEIRASFKDLHVIVHFEQRFHGRGVKNQGEEAWKEGKAILECVVGLLFTVGDNWDSILSGPSEHL